MKLDVQHAEQRIVCTTVRAVGSFDERRDVILHASSSLSGPNGLYKTTPGFGGCQSEKSSSEACEDGIPSRLLARLRTLLPPLLRIGNDAERGCEIDLVILFLPDQLLQHFCERVFTELFGLANAL